MGESNGIKNLPKAVSMYNQRPVQTSQPHVMRGKDPGANHRGPSVLHGRNKGMVLQPPGRIQARKKLRRPDPSPSPSDRRRIPTETMPQVRSRPTRLQ